MTSKALLATIGANIRAEIVRAGRTQREAGEVIGLSQSQMSQRLTGVVPLRIDEVFALAAWLNVSIDRFLLGVTTEGGALTDAALLMLPRLDSNQQPAGYLPAAVKHYRDHPKWGVNLPPLPPDTPASRAA